MDKPRTAAIAALFLAAAPAPAPAGDRDTAMVRTTVIFQRTYSNGAQADATRFESTVGAQKKPTVTIELVLRQIASPSSPAVRLVFTPAEAVEFGNDIADAGRMKVRPRKPPKP